MKMAASLVVFGLLIAIICLYVQLEGLPLEYRCPSCPDNSGLTAIVSINPGPELVIAKVLNIMAIIIGLAVVVCGIIQFWKAKKSG